MANGKLTLKNVMTKKVDTISPETGLSEILRLLKKRKGLPVVNEQKQIIGIVTEYDLLKVEKNPNNLKMAAKDVMNPNPFTLPENASFKDAENVFIEHHKINPIPIVDKNNRVIGIVSRADILRPLGISFWIKKGFFTYFSFLKRSIFSIPEDIERPHHKIANLILKILGISFTVAGLSLAWSGTQKYIIEYQPLVRSSYEQQASYQDSNLQQKDDLYREIMFLIISGMACLFVAASIGPVLLLRYIAFTLPDRIYYRAFATPEERMLKKNAGKNIKL